MFAAMVFSFWTRGGAHTPLLPPVKKAMHVDNLNRNGSGEKGRLVAVDHVDDAVARVENGILRQL